ncbi:MAG: glycosyltransferase family 4 protein [Desulfurococcus sp.]|nr:glycosyltransferase family 4 protein [Desulfurococcus sp.]
MINPRTKLNVFRVLLVTDQCISPGGITRYTRLLFKESSKKGYDVHMICYYDNAYISRYRVATKSIRTLASFFGRKLPPPFPDPVFLAYILRIVMKHRPDIIHAHGLSAITVLPVASILRIPLIVHLHDYGFICLKRDMFDLSKLMVCKKPTIRRCLRCGIAVYGFKAAILYILLKLFAQLLTRAASIFISPSEYVKNVHVRYLNKLERKIIIIPNCVSLIESKTQSTTNELLKRYGLENSEYLLYVGKISLHKGVHDLIKAFIIFKYNHLINHSTNIKLVMAGTIDKQFKPLIEKVTNVKDILILTEVTDGELNELYSNAKGIILAPRWPEVFGLTAFEAMLYKKPIIITNVGGLIEYAKLYPFLYICAPGDHTCLIKAMKEIVNSKVQNGNYQEKTVKMLNKLSSFFSCQNILDKIMKLYEALK